MKKILYLFSFLILIACDQKNSSKETANSEKETGIEKDTVPNYGIVIHGGAGTILKENLSDSLENAYKTKLEEAIRTGHEILANGGTALEAVQRTINVMENSPLFNSAKGAVFTNDGKNELDASIMDGETLNAGAVAGVTNVKNPINLAYEVMVNSEHVLLSGKGAEQFAEEQGLEIVDP
ncbi:MAG TPA: isoaspartyl peptidase/L-asparaginase, partial [Christiangramia sp.]|nr:isoaspartyl peptidase/L-asparaginase [Christiangramia sp.]